MAYKGLAFYYDDVMIDAPYDKWVEFTRQIIKYYDKDVHTIADLGCGTGEITLRLAQLGYETIGIDYSADMLTMADQKSGTSQRSVQWMKQDIRTLTGLPNQDLIISYCDVINYITTKEDLSATFQNVYNSLNQNGLFVFDVHSLHYTETALINQTFADVQDHFNYIWFCHEGESPGEMIHEIVCFAENQDQTFDRFVEIHEQRTFSESVYCNLLKESGFKSVDIYKDFSLKHNSYLKDGNRLFFVVSK